MGLCSKLLVFSGQSLGCFRGGRMVFIGLSFELRNGDALVIRGPNGSGKSSLLRLMAGLLQPVGGKIHWSDIEGPIDDNLEDHCNRTHYVGHANAFKPLITVQENIAFWSRLRTPDPDVMEALQTFDLKNLADSPVQFLSQGQMQRLKLARILAAPADLWLLDEPATALDSSGITSLCNAIETHRGKGGIIATATHQELNLDNSKILHINDFAIKDFPCE